MEEDAPQRGEKNVSKWVAGLSLERSRAKKEQYAKQVIGDETRLKRELRLSQLYGANTVDPFIKRRTLRSPTTADDPLLPPVTPPSGKKGRRRRKKLSKSGVITGRPGWKPAGPRVATLERTSRSVDDRPADPYLEPWSGNPHQWDPETEFVTGSYAEGAYCVEVLPSHHGLTAFQKLHKDNAKRKFKRGMTKLTAMLRMQSVLKSFGASRKPVDSSSKAAEKRASVNNILSLLRKKGFTKEGVKIEVPAASLKPKLGRTWGAGRPRTSPVGPKSHLAVRRKQLEEEDQDKLVRMGSSTMSALPLSPVAAPTRAPVVVSPSRGGSPPPTFAKGGGGAARTMPHTLRRIHHNCTVLDTHARTKDAPLTDPVDKTKRRQALRMAMRWRELGILHEWLTTGPDAKPNFEDLDALRTELRKAAAENGSAHLVTRDQFWAILSTRNLPLSNSNRLFSSFDVNHDNKVDLREFVASLRSLRRPREDLTDKLVGTVAYYSGFKDDLPISRADTLTCVLLLCRSDSDRATLEHALTDAMVDALGMKSIWAKDITPTSLGQVVYYSTTLTAELRRIAQALHKK